MSSSPTDGARNGDGGATTQAAAPAARTVEVTMPQMGVSMAEGTVALWHKRVGEEVRADEPICDIVTDKVDTEIPAPVSGTLAEILVDADETVPVGTVLARIAGSARDGAPEAPPSPPAGGRASAGAGGASGERRGPAAPREDGHARREAGTEPGGRYYSPVVRRIASREGVDLAQVPGGGRGERVRKQDVLAYIERRRNGTDAQHAQEAPLHIESPYREPAPPAQTDMATDTQAGERLSIMRRSIARHMLSSLQTAAHCTSVAEVDMSAVERARGPLGLTYLPFVAACAVQALRAHPDLNATLEGESLTRHRAVNLGIAVSLEREGLIVPVIHDAQELSHEGLARRIAELARRARAGELRPEEVQGGTFTITNPGGYGTLISTPIINQPQVAILDLEAVVRRPVVLTDDAGRDSIAVRPMAYLCLSWDHRALDGALAAQFLATLRRHIERWGGM